MPPLYFILFSLLLQGNDFWKGLQRGKLPSIMNIGHSERKLILQSVLEISLVS